MAATFLSGLISPIASIVNKLIPDKAAAAAAQAQLQTMALNGQITEELTQLQSITSAQSDINKVEAANPSVLVAGWRPMVGWVCATALAFQYILRPLIGIGCAIAHYPIPVLPGIDDNLWQLMFGLLGMGAIRSFDKLKGIATAKVG